MKTEELIKAIETGDLEKAKACVAAGVDVNGYSYPHYPITAAVINRQVEIIKYLVSQGASIEQGIAYAQEQKKFDMVPLLQGLQYERTPEWSLFGKDGVAHMEYSVVLHRKLTEIFNFATRQHINIVTNDALNVETVLPATSFEALPASAVETALAKFTEMDGVADSAFVLTGKTQVAKQAIPAKQGL
jgi:hypothetical protein